RDLVPWSVRRVLEAFDLMGTADATITFAGDPAAPQVAVEGSVAGGHLRYDGYVKQDGKRRGFPWELTEVAGKVSYARDRLKIEGTGRHGPASVRAGGEILLLPAGVHDVTDITIVAENAPLD